MSSRNDFELLAPAGDMEKLKVAIHYGADAVYFAGTKFGLRAFATNFSNIATAVEYAHSHGVKAYVTVNIYPRNNDLEDLEQYLKELEADKVDGIIVSDIGIMDLARRVAPGLELHISTQANTTNMGSALAYVNHFGAKRVVLARELPFEDVSEITKQLKKVDAEVEIFVHGAMCISYSGRCLLSNYLTGRDSNRGECVQACRYSYFLSERPDAKENAKFASDREGMEYEIEEDERGTYILNSKDMCLIHYMDKLMGAGVRSFKIEGRMKSPYYLGVVVNAYRRAIDSVLSGKQDKALAEENYTPELEKSSHRKFTTGFMFNDGEVRQNYETSHQTQSSMFLGMVVDSRTVDGHIELKIEMRNRFKVGDSVEVLSSGECFNKRFTIVKMENEKGEEVLDAKNVQQNLWITLSSNNATDNKLLSLVTPLDIIRSI